MLQNVIILIRVCYFYYYNILWTCAYLWGTQILSTLNLSDITLQFRIAAMFVIFLFMNNIYA
jgi:hypothetical protein